MEPQIPHTRRYASVILPVKFSGEVSYIVPNIFEVERGSRVKVELANRIYPGVVKEILSAEDVPTHTPDGKEIQYKPLLSVEPLPKILPTEIELWEQVAQYYLCSVGEVFKAAYPALTVKQESVKPRKTVEMFLTAIENEQVVQNCDVIIVYSLFNELTGFSIAALRLPTVTTTDTITATMQNARAKIHKLIEALYAKVL